MPRHEGIIVGAGGIARSAHLPAYSFDAATAQRLKIVAAIDSRDPPPELDGLPVYASLDAAITAHPGISFVDICTPTATHQPLILEAFARGLHVFCEKPVAIDAAEARGLAAAAGSAGRVLFPCHQYRQNPAWRALRDAVDRGAIGDWHLAEFHVYRGEADRGAGGAGVPWRGTRAAALGGVLLDHGTHLLYLMIDMGGMPDSVHAHLATLGHSSYDVEDTAHVLLDYGRRVATMTLTWAGSQRENRIRFIGNAGMVEWVGGELRVVSKDGTTERTDYTAQLDKKEYAGWMSRMLHQFADTMDRGDSATSIEEIVNVATLLESAYESAASGCRVRLR